MDILITLMLYVTPPWKRDNTWHQKPRKLIYFGAFSAGAECSFYVQVSLKSSFSMWCVIIAIVGLCGWRNSTVFCCFGGADLWNSAIKINVKRREQQTLIKNVNSFVFPALRYYYYPYWFFLSFFSNRVDIAKALFSRLNGYILLVVSCANILDAFSREGEEWRGTEM